MPIYLAKDAAESEIVSKALNCTCYSMDTDVTHIFSSDEPITTVATTYKLAKKLAIILMGKGVSATRLSYMVFGETALPRHMFWDDVVPLSELPDSDDFPVYKSGIGFLDKNLGWGWRMRELCIAAGAYSSGKSTFGQILAAEFFAGAGSRNNSGVLLCSWEDLASEVKRNFTNFGKHRNVNNILEHTHFVRRSADKDRLIPWFCELVTYHRERYNTRFFFLDPWNEMDHQKNARQAETEYVADTMKSFRRLVDKLNIILVIATHVPAARIRGDGTIEPFRIAHAFGSVQFANKADRGICIMRTRKLMPPKDEFGNDTGPPLVDENGFAIIRLDKSKIERKMGKKGVVACRFDPERFSYIYDREATRYVQDIWRD